MSYVLGEPTVQQYFDSNGDPLVNGTIEFYLSGTTTPTSIYSDSAGTAIGTSVTLNSFGAPANSGTAVALFFDTTVSYKIVRKDAAGVEIAPTIDPYMTPKSASAKDFGAAGDGVTDDTIAMQAAFDAGGFLVIPSGTFLCDALTITTPIHVLCAGTLKLRTVPAHRDALVKFDTGSEGSLWYGGIMDGDRVTHSGSHVRNTLEWFNLSINTDRVTVQDVTHKNSTWFALWCEGDDAIANNHRYVTCGAGFRVTGASRVQFESHFATGLDNNGEDFNQHAHDIWDTTDSHFKGIATYNQDGDTGGSSTFISGITIVNCTGCVFDGLKAHSFLPDDLIHVAVTMLGLTRCAVSNVSAYDFAGTGVEVNGWHPSNTLDGFVVDANYKNTSVKAKDVTVGFDFNGGSFYSNTARRSIRAASGINVSDGIVRRCGTGVFIRGRDLLFSNVRAEGNLVDGWRINAFAFTAQFAGAASNRPHVTLSSCMGSYNNACGVAIDDANYVRIEGGEYIGNGQDTSLIDSRRSGIGDFSNSPVQYFGCVGAVVKDAQTVTGTDGVSFTPGSTTSNQYTFTCIEPNYMPRIGQTVTLSDVVSGPADATGQCVAISQDEFTLEFSGSVTFVDTSSLTSLTGTLTQSATATILTGAGTAFDTEVTGPMWLKIGSEYRQVVAVSSATSLTIDSAFTAAPSGASAQVIKCDIVGVPSQTYGIYLGSSTASWFINGVDWGNDEYLVEPFRNQSNLLAKAVPGSVYLLGEKSGAFTAATNRHPVITDIPAGHRVLGGRVKLLTEWTSASTLNMQLRTQSGTLVTDLGALSAIAVNTVFRAGSDPNDIPSIADVNLESGGNPSAGTCKMEVLVAADVPLAYS